MKKKEEYKELAARYGIDLNELKKEQLRLSKQLQIRGDIRPSFLGGIKNIFSGNKIISGVVIMKDEEVVDEEYFIDKVKFPYIPGFRAYRELTSMVKVLNKIRNNPDLVFVNSHGILHPRELGLASHFSLSTGIPSVGVADSLLIGDEEGAKIKVDDKLKGMKVHTKQGAKPLIVSPGNKISVENAARLVKKFTYKPHKFPEVLDEARKYVKKIRKEMFR